MKLKVKHHVPFTPGALSIRCPHCGSSAAVQPLDYQYKDIDIGDGIWCGQRYCPSPGCGGHIFVAHRQGSVVASYPVATIDFDVTDVPANIVASFDEALRSHANGCFMAAALLVRRTLEEVCADKGASGKDLKLRLADLKGKVLIPDELFAAMDELRLLGNDAAHIEAKSYDKISKEEIEVAIEFAKEFLKALYQYGSLLARLRALKKPDAA